MRFDRCFHITRPFFRGLFLLTRRSGIRASFFHLRRFILARCIHLTIMDPYLRPIRFVTHNVRTKRIRALQGSRFTSYFIFILYSPRIDMKRNEVKRIIIHFKFRFLQNGRLNIHLRLLIIHFCVFWCLFCTILYLRAPHRNRRYDNDGEACGSGPFRAFSFVYFFCCI